MAQEIKILATKPDDLSAALGFSRFLPCFPVAVINAMTKTNLGRKGISSYSLHSLSRETEVHAHGRDLDTRNKQ